MRMNTGINNLDRKIMVNGLNKFLAQSYTLYLKSQKFHWNVTGQLFQSLHTMFEAQYLELAIAIDLIAERIRALGFPTPATFSEFLELSSIKEETGVPTAEEMITLLMEGHEELSTTAHNLYKIADEVNDQTSAELLAERMRLHEKTAWMLRSMLEPVTT